jgi:glycosyltransferase involved in cell wall biosynthesis
MNKIIVILSGNHLCHNPRCIKEASALARAGFGVVVLGAWIDPGLKARDLDMLAGLPFSYRPVIDFTSRRLRARVQKFLLQIRGKAARFVQKIWGIESRYLLGPIVDALHSAAMAERADLYIAHSESALFVAQLLLDSGKLIAVDMEDWYSEDLLPEARAYRPIGLLQRLERKLLREGAQSTCPSRAMGDALSAAYGCRSPSVLYNAASWGERESISSIVLDRRNRSVPSIHWYSQTIGMGRGLEDLFAALPFITQEIEIHLRGNQAEGFDIWLSSKLPEGWHERVFIHALVPNNQLISRIAEHDIGFAGEMNYCRSRSLTITNKILDYLMAGLAVVASDTAGQCEVSRQAPDAVRLYRSGDALALATQLNALLESRDALVQAKAAALRAAEQTFCWERQEDRLVDMITRTLTLLPPRLPA